MSWKHRFTLLCGWIWYLGDGTSQLGTGFTGYLAQVFGGWAGDINGIGPVPLPGAAAFGAAAADGRAEV